MRWSCCWTKAAEPEYDLRRVAASVLLAILLTTSLPERERDGRPHIRSESAIIRWADTKEIVLAKDPDHVRPIASVTKLLSTLLLARDGYGVSGARHGEAGIELARSTTPDLVLVDLQMPGLDGFGVLAALKSNPSTSDIPIIVVSGSVNDQDIVRALELGATDYVSKPYAIDILLVAHRPGAT